MVKQSIKQIPRQDVIVIVIEESNREDNPGMLLSCSFKPDLSHASILYY
jgi:hypothetical protein